MTYILLLRGVNVGGRVIKMVDLKTCLEKAGYTKVGTILQSGNVVFESQKSSAKQIQTDIEKVLTAKFKYPARVAVLTPTELSVIIKKCPFPDPAPDFHRYVVFTESGFEKELAGQAIIADKNMEQVLEGKGVVYWRVSKGQTLESSFGKQMAKIAAKHFLTNRNMNTLEKILKKA